MTASVAQAPRAWRRFPQIFIAASRRDQRALVDCGPSSTRGAAMSRFTMALVAAATAAIAAIAVVALPAVGDDSGGGNDMDQFAACLRTHGLADAPSDPMTLKPWIMRKQATDPEAVDAAMRACKRILSSKPAVTAPGPEIQDMIDCVRKHGFADAPSDPVAFKQWLGRQQAANSDQLNAALKECKLAPDPGAKPGAGKPPADCGAPPADKPAAPPAEKPDDGATERGV
jgi:hypothetical protein